MAKKIISVFMSLLVFCALLSGCFSQNSDEQVSQNLSSQISTSSDDSSVSIMDGEYPLYNEGAVFSDMPTVLIPDETSSQSSSSSKPTSSKPTSSKPTSSKPTSSLSSADKSSSQNTTTQAQSSNISSNNTAVINKDTIKAVWISYIDLSSILTKKSESEFRQNFEAVCLNAKNFGLNTLVCQVRAHSDAIYNSEYFPWAEHAAGLGKNPGYDPMKIMIELSHKHNLSFHAWINPFRAFWDSQVPSVPSSTTFKKWYNDSGKKGKYIVKVKESNGRFRWYLNPGEPEVRKLIVDGIKEIINNYSVDGIHFDDYFYHRTIDNSFDSSTYSKYGAGKTLAKFRTDSVNNLVKDVYTAVKSKNSKIIFGISPDANVTSNLNTLYADVKLWGSTNGYVDYLCPQIYYSYKSETTNFTTALNTWNNLVTASNVKLMVGLAPYKIGYKEDYWACTNANREKHKNSTSICGMYGWQTSDSSKSDILARQCADSLSLKKCNGVFLYSYQYVFGINSSLLNSATYTQNAVNQAKTEMKNLKETLK